MDRRGWAKAPPVVEAEIRTVWQEDEMPAEITKAPGYRPFTLGTEAQEWVDSMAEVVDGGKAVYGRPKSVTPTQHRQLATSPTPPPAAPPRSSQPTFQRANPPQPLPPGPPPKPRVVMPDIEEAPAPPKPRVLMPETGEQSPPAARRVLMPEAGESPPATSQRVLMPDIDDSAPARPRTLPRRILMPDIGDEPTPPTKKPPAMPEIG